MKTPTFLMSALALWLTETLHGAPAEATLNDCPSGSMCLWSKPNYAGTIKKISTTGAYRSTGLSTVGSYYNNRSKRSWLHATPDGSGTYTCLDPGRRSANVSGWQSSAKAVYLATITDC